MLFKKLHVMPYGQSPKIRGAICKAPINTTDINDKFLRQADSSGLIIVKIKMKLAYSGHACQLLQYLKSNNEFYSHIEVDISHIPSSLIEMIN